MKGSPIDAIIKAIRTINSGGKAIAAEILRFLKEDPTPTDLSKRQREVLLGVAGGKTSDQIADELGISVSAVKQHITAACEKLGASSRAEAAAIALKKHLLKL
jgi:DNA-binding NarL/FixJ family response regulator